MRCYQQPNGGYVKRAVTPMRPRESGTKRASYLEEATLTSSSKSAKFVIQLTARRAHDQLAT